MIVFNSDLDNTIIYSYKHDIGTKKRCVEIYQNRELSFVTERTYMILKQLMGKVLFVPTTTRTKEQYERIELGIGMPEYALVCNGGVLLVNGKEDEEWYQQSLHLIEDCKKELDKAKHILETDDNVTYELRNIKELFWFTKSEKPLDSVNLLKSKLDTRKVDVISNGVKIYVVPKRLSKGYALKRFRQRVKADTVIAAGDSEFDLSMLCEADVAIAPKELSTYLSNMPHTVFTENKGMFSEELLKAVELELVSLRR